MITEDDARRTLEFDYYYIIQPEFPWWSDESQAKGKEMPDGFKYTSDLNTEWLTIDELRSLVIDM